MAIDNGELAKDTDPRQLAFDMLGIILVFYRTSLLLGGDESRDRDLFDQRFAPQPDSGQHDYRQ
jgi:hypothetical protein